MKQFYALFTVVVLFFFNSEKVFSQACNCSTGIRTRTVDISSNPDTIVNITGVARTGLCCNQTGTDCIRFIITLNPGATEFSFNVMNPAPPQGAASYQIDCGTVYTLGQKVCASNLPSTFCLTYCKSGNDQPTYSISSGRGFFGSADITLSAGCTGTMSVTGLNATTILWNSISPGVSGAYNSYLSCTSGCSTTNVTPPLTGYPTFIDYVVSGTPTGCSSGTVRDTIRVNIVPGKIVTISPENPSVCFGNNTTTITANVTGGSAPYTYSWSNGGTTQSINVGPGTYTVTVTDQTNSANCAPTTATVTVTQFNANITANAGPDQTVCATNPTVTLSGSVTVATGGIWSNGTGTYNASNTQLDAQYTPSTAEVSAGFATLILTTTGNGGCTPGVDTMRINITPTPIVTASNSGPVCAGQNLTLSATPGTTGTYSYSWTGPNNFSSTQQNPVITAITSAQAGTYTVTAIVNGCPSAPATTSVTVNPSPVVTATPSSQTICSGGSTSIALTSTMANTSFAWTVTTTGSVTGASAGSGTSIIQTLTNSGTTAGTVTYRVTPTASGCSGLPLDVVVTVNPTPAATATPSSQTICSGQTTNIALTSNVTGTTFTWTAANTAPASGATSGSGTTIAQTLTNTGTTAGTSTYTVTPTANGCSGASINVPVTVNPRPIATATPSTPTICSGQTTSIALTGNVTGTTFTWTASSSASITGASSGSGSSITQTLTNSSNTAGTVTYTITPSANGCTGITTTATVTVNPAPVVTATPSSQTICSGQSTAINLTSNVTGTTFSWTVSAAASITGASAGSGTTISQTLTNLGTTAATATYTVTPSVNGCNGTPVNVVITVNPTPTVTATPSSQNICSGQATNITLSSNITGTTFSWTVSAPTTVTGASAGSGSTIVQTLTSSSSSTQTVTYTVTPSAFSCPGTSTTVTINVNPAPTATATPSSQTICSGQTTNISLTSTTAAATFSWTVTSSASVTGALTGSGSTIAQTLVNSGASAGTVTYTITPNAGGCNGTPITATITVNPTPAATATPSSQTICSGQTTNIALSSNVTGTTFAWSAANTAPASGASSGSGTTIVQTLTNTGTAAGTSTYTITPTANGCAGTSINVPVTVNPRPVATATPATSTICSGQTTSIDLTGNVTGTTFTWTATSSASVTGASSGSGNTIAQVLVNSSTTAGTVTYTITPTASGCTGSTTTATVTVNPTPVVTATPSSQTICSGQTTAISLTSNITGTSFSWTVSAPSSVTGAIAGTGSTINQTLTSSSPTAQVVTYTITPLVNGCNGNSTVVEVTVSPIPPAPTAAGATICEGTSTTLTSTAPGGSYQWYSASTGGTLLGAGSTFTTPVLSTNTSYYVQTTVNGCTSSRTQVTVTITPTPAAPTAAGTTICAGSSATLTATAPGGIYEWYSASSGGTLLETGFTLTTPTLTATTTYYVQTTVSGCTSARTAVTVTVNPIPSAPTAAGQTICSGSSATLTATAPGGTYQWYSSPGGSILGTGPTFSTGTLTASTSFYVNTIVNGCTSPYTTVNVTVNPIPAAPTANGTTICSGNSTILTASGSTGTYQWYSALTGGTLLGSSANFTTPVLTATTTYYVQTTVNGCPSTRTSVTVTVNPTPSAPTAPGVTICEGNTATLTATVPGGTYTWFEVMSGGTAIHTGASYTTPVLVENDTLYVQSTSTDGCTGPRTMVVVTVTPTDNPSFNYSSGTYCITGSNPTPTITGLAGGTFSATPSGLSINSSTGTISVSTSSLNTYTITYTTNGPCPTSTTRNVTITNSPDASFSYTTPVCQGENNPIPTFPTGASAGVFSATPTGLSFVSTSTGEVNLTASVAGTYTITNFIAASGGCASATSTNAISINPAATVNAGSNAVICEGTSASLSGTIGGAATSFTWSGGTGSFGSTTSLNTTYSPSASEITAGSVKLYLTTNDPAGPCPAAVDSIIISITPLPAAPTASGTTICAGDSTSLAATAPGGTYTWYSASTGGTLIFTGSIYNTPALFNSTTYYVQSTINNCASPRTPVTVNVTPLPAAPTVADQTICSGSTATLTATAPGGDYAWFTAATGGSAISNSATFTTPALTSTTVYYVQATVNGCTGPRDTVTVTVNPIPSAPTAGSRTICSGSSATLTATAPGGAYNWFDAPGGNLLGTGSSFNTGVLTATTSFYVNTTVAGCTSAFTTVTVTVNPIPAAPTANGTTICEGNSATLSATAPGGTYSWFMQASGGSAISTGANFTTPNLTTTTTYYVQTTIGGCISPRTAVTVNVTPNDDPSFSYSSGTYCISGTNPTPTITGTAGGTFSASSTALSINSSTGTINLAASQLGTYTITYTTSGSCPRSSSVSLTVTNTPDANFSFTGPYCQFGTNPLPTFPAGASAGVFSSTAGLQFVSTSTGEVNLQTSTPGTYTVTNFIAAAGGCASATATNTISIEPAPTVNANVDQTVCVGATVQLNGSFGGVANSATWSGGGGNFDPNPSTLNAVYTPTASEYSNSSLQLILTTNAPEGACSAAADSMRITFIQDNPSFAYSSGTYCITGSNATPVITGGFTGTFSSTPSGLVFVNTSTGEINVGASNLGTYNITFTTNGPCPASRTVQITITTAPDASFSYTTPVCSSSGNILPNFPTGSSAGIFSATPSGLTFSSTSIGEIDVQNSLPGTYTITNDIAAAGGCAPATATFSFTINPRATVDAGSNMAICAGNTANLNATFGGGATSVTWTNGTGIYTPDNTSAITAYSPSTAEVNAGQALLILISNDPLGPCTAASDSVLITINPVPNSPTVNGATICENNSAVLTATAPGGTYNWFSQPSGGTSLGTGSSFNTGILTSTTNYYVQTTVNGCTSTPRTQVLVSVLQSDDPSFVYSSGTYCVSGSNPIATITGGATGVFSAAPTGITFANTSTGEIDIQNSSLGTYTIQFKTSGQCPDSATTVLTITDTPDASFSYNDPFCTGSGSASAIFANGASGGIFTATPSGLNFSNTSTGVINLNATTAGTYSVTNDIPAAGGCVSATHTETVVILPSPTASITGSNSVCSNNASIELTATATNYTGLTWTSNGTGSFTPNDTSSAVTYNPDSNDLLKGEVTIYLTAQGNGTCSPATDSLVVTITSAPIVNAGPDTLYICEGQMTVELNGSVIGGSGTGMWSTLGTGNFDPSAATLNTNYLVNSADTLAGGFTLILESTNNGNCLTVYDTMQVRIITLPVVFAGNDFSVCSSEDIQLNGTVTGGNGNGIWTSSGTGTFTPSANDLNAIYNPSPEDIQNGNVILVLEPEVTCDAVSDSVTVTIITAPTATITAPTAICSGENIALNSTSSNTSGITWSSTGTGIFSPDTISSPVQYIPSSGDITSGTVTIILTPDPAGSCPGSSDTVTVAIQLKPVPDFRTDTICAGSPTQFTDLSTGSINTWSWNLGNGNTSSVQNPSFTFTTSGNINVVLTVSTSAGCMDSITKQVIVNPSAVASFSGGAFCSQEPVTFANTSTGATSFTWNFGDNNTSTETNPTHTYQSSGTYVVMLIATSQPGCNDTASSTLSIGPAPEAAFIPNGGTYNVNDVINFTDQSIATSSWIWYFGIPGQVSTEQNPSFTFTSPGTYSVMLSASNGSCADTVAYTFIINPGNDEVVLPIGLPTAFSPNGDGTNDILFVKGGPFKAITSRIYNAWGNLIFESNDQAIGWNGTYKGVPQPAGKYIWIVGGETLGGEPISVQTEVTIIR